VAAGAAACSDDDDDPAGPSPSGLRGTWVGTAYFGFTGAPQPITIVIDSDGTTFSGAVVTDNVPDGVIIDGLWDGTRATWETVDLAVTAEWEAHRSGDEMTGSIINLSLSFEATRQ
jgi:hypothetical protein